MSATTHKLTYQDDVCFPDDGRWHEIIDGNHYASPAPSTDHQAASRHIQLQLYQAMELTGLGQVLNAPVDVQLTPHDIVQPDLVVVLNERQIITRSKVKGVPNHVIEILSPSSDRTDRVMKFNLYQNAGVPEYWILNLLEYVVEQYMLGKEGYEKSTHNREVTCTYLSPSVSVDLGKVW